MVQNALTPLAFDTLDAVEALVPRRLVMVLLLLALTAMCAFAWWIRRLQRRLGVLEVEVQQSNNRANALVLMYDGLRQAFDRRTIGYNRARQAFVDQRAAAAELQGALALATQDLGAGYQAQVDLRQHVGRCPLGEEIHIQDGSAVWHRDDECDELYDSGREIRVFQPCAICAVQDLVIPGDDATRFFDEHGVRVVNAPPGMQFTWGQRFPSVWSCMPCTFFHGSFPIWFSPCVIRRYWPRAGAETSTGYAGLKRRLSLCCLALRAARLLLGLELPRLLHK